MSAFRLVCAGCGTPVAPIHVEPHPFRCRSADVMPEIDHVVTKTIDPGQLAWPAGADDNPFLRYRTLLYSHDVASGFSRKEAPDYRDLVTSLDDRVAAVSGQRFRITPFGRQEDLGRALGFSGDGGLWVKDETGNVSGSHKARHLAGIMLYLLCVQDDPNAERPDLAIASCGNAALAAAVVARAAGWTLQAFVPPDANAAVLARLRELGTSLVICPREDGTAGDPCYRGFRAAIAEGAIPFCCQGPDNGLTIEGGETLAYEIVDALGERALDAIVVQVGGGALASACVQGFERAVALGRIRRMPRVYTVQTHGAAPLARAHARVAERAARTTLDEALRHAATHRSEFMWPWETAPRSLAHGILDDETYDWLAVVRGMLQTGGGPVIADEEMLAEAHRLGRELTGIDVDPTGTAGLAGLMALRARGDVQSHEQVAVIFSGVRR
jgi:threonine synthase